MSLIQCPEIVSVFKPKMEQNFTAPLVDFNGYSIDQIRDCSGKSAENIKVFLRNKADNDFSTVLSDLDSAIQLKKAFVKPYTTEINSLKKDGTNDKGEITAACEVLCHEIREKMDNHPDHIQLLARMKCLESQRNNKRIPWHDLFTDCICSYFAASLAPSNQSERISIHGISVLYDIMTKYCPEAMSDTKAARESDDFDSFFECMGNIMNFIGNVSEITQRLELLFGESFPLELFGYCSNCKEESTCGRKAETENSTRIQLCVPYNDRNNSLTSFFKNKFVVTEGDNLGSIDCTKCSRPFDRLLRKSVKDLSSTLLSLEVISHVKNGSLSKDAHALKYDDVMMVPTSQGQNNEFKLVSLVVFQMKNHYENYIVIEGLRNWFIYYPNSDTNPDTNPN